MSELLYAEEVFKLIGFCREIHREFARAGVPFSRECSYGAIYKGVPLPHRYCAGSVIWDRIVFEAKAIEKLVDVHVKQVLNYWAASKLRLGLLVNFGADSLEWKRVVS
jgi:GxxExxY protein